MTTTVIANGHTYTDDDDPVTGMGNGGFRVRLLPMLSDIMVETNADRAYADATLASANAAAANAAASAASAIATPNTNGTSTTSLTPSVASKTFTSQTGKTWVVGMWVTVADTTTPSTRWMNGPITAYNSGTGSTTVAVTRARGTGASSTWTISASAPGVPDTGQVTSSSAVMLVGTTSNRYQVNKPAGAGAAFSVTAAATQQQGPNVFSLRNQAGPGGYGYGYDVAINAFSGTDCYLPPDRQAELNGGTAEWDISGETRPYGTVMMDKVTFSSAVAGTGGLYTKSLLLTGSTQLVLVHGASLHAVLYDPANFPATLQSPAQIRTGLVAAGDDGSVYACMVNDGSNDVIVASVNGTALQVVRLTIAASTITLGTPLSITLGTAWTKIQDMVPAGLGSGRFMITGLTSATSCVSYGLEISGATLVAGTAVTNTIVSSVVTQLPRTSDNVVTLLLAASATQIAARPYTVGAGGALTLGTVATATTTAVTYLAVRYDSSNALWAVMLVNTTVRVAALTVSAAPAAAFSTSVVFQGTVTSLTAAYGGGNADLAGSPFYIAVTGTVSSRPVTEFWSVGFLSGIPTGNASALVYTDAAATAVYVNDGRWQLATATEVTMVAPSYGFGTYPDDWRMPGAATYAQTATPLDNSDIKATKPRNLLRSTARALTVLDGAKPSLQYSNYGWAEPTSIPVRLINTAANSRALNVSANYQDTVWAAAGPNPSATLTIQCLHLA